MNEVFAIFQSTPWLLYSFTAVFGLLIGSFLNVVIYRTPKMLEQEWNQQAREMLGEESQEEERITLSTPSSTCPHCGHKIRPWENIPVISYLFLRGKCSNCGTHISVRYPIIELVTALLSVLVVYYYGASYLSLGLLVFTWTLISLTMIDADTQLLPDSMTLPLLWLGLIINSFGLLTSLESAVWGAIAGYLSLWSVYHAFRLVTGKEGMGYGDFKLLAALGAWLGWTMLPIIILLSSVVGAVIGISMILLKGRDRNVPMPFGPYLAIAGFIALIWGPNIVTWLY